MATGSQTATSGAQPVDLSSGSAQFVEYEAFIETQLRKTRSQVRGVDIAAAVMSLATATLGYFLGIVVIDHWLIGGGLGIWGRTLLLAIYLGGALWWTLTQIAPLLFRKINPLYAAQTIERSRPTLKNALVNFLFFRSAPDTVHQRVLEQIEQQAATSLVGVEVESAVDRSRLVRIGYVLVALVALGALYAIISPKNPFKTVSRILAPWADIAPPTSTTIDELEPGDTQAFRGQQITVKARVQGIADGQQVLLYYTTADRQIVDRAVEMFRPANDYRYAAVLPASDAALQQSLTYRLEAGDARTRDYRIEVAAAPTIVVQAVEYKYPAYTGLLGQRVERQGDLKALEGTEVTLEGLANQPIGKAFVDFGANGSLDLAMRAENTTARTSFRLGLTADRQKPEHEVYQLTFKNTEGQENPQPVKHRIEVVPDLSPEIQFVQPAREEIEVAADGVVELELVANDPDFALAEVRLVTRHGDRQLDDKKLLGEPWRGQYLQKHRFSPAAHKLVAGDVVEYHAVAIDNKSPRPNRTETARRRIRVTPALGRSEDDPAAKHDDTGRPQAGAQPPTQPTDQASQPPQPQQQGVSGKESQAGASADESTPQDGGNSATRDESSANNPSGEPPDGTSSNSPNPTAGEQQQPGSEQAAKQSSGDNSTQGDSSAGGAEQSGQSESQQSGGQTGNQGSGGQQGAAQQQSSGDRASRGGASRGTQQQQPPTQQEGASSGEGQEGAGQSGTGQKSGGGSSTPNQTPVASDGTNDGDAIERILKHRDQQNANAQATSGEKSNGREQAGQGGDANQGDQSGTAGQQAKDNRSDSSAQPSDKTSDSSQQRPSHSAKSDSASGQSGDPRTNDSPQQGPPSSSQSEGAQPSVIPPGQQPERAANQDQAASGLSGKSESGGDPSNASPSGARPSEKSDSTSQQSGKNAANENASGEQSSDQQSTSASGAPGDNADGARDSDSNKDGTSQNANSRDGKDGKQENGEAGTGGTSPADGGSPKPKASPAHDGAQQAGGKSSGEKPSSDESSASSGQPASDATSDARRDRSASGKPDGSPPGTSTDGEQTDRRTDNAGTGETGDRARGSQQAPSPGGDPQPGGNQAPGVSPNESASGDPADDQNSGEANFIPNGQSGITQHKAVDNRGQPWQPGADRAADANLDYTRKATEFALEHLKDQLARGGNDDALLEELGWTREEADAFLRRWETLRSQAQAPGTSGETGRRELNETLRSLGLQPRGSAIQSGTGPGDRAGGLQESRRTTPPPEYSEAFKAYTQGTARGGK